MGSFAHEGLVRELDVLRRQLTGDPARVDPDVVFRTLEELERSIEEMRAAEQMIVDQGREIERTRGEAELERLRYRELFDAAPEAYVVTDLEGVIVEANGAAGSVFGVRPRYLGGKPLLLFVQEQSRPRLRSWLSRVSRRTTRRGFTLDMVTRSGRRYVAWTSVTVVRRPDGSPCGLRWLILDRDRQGREERLRLLFRSLPAEAARSDGGGEMPGELAEWLPRASDELRIAVARVAATAATAVGGDGAAGDGGRLAAAIGALRRLADDFAEVAGANPAVRRGTAAIDLRSVVRTAAGEAAAAFLTGAGEPSLVLPAAEITVDGDEKALRRMIVSLLADATREGADGATTEIEVAGDRDHARVAIRRPGPGARGGALPPPPRHGGEARAADRVAPRRNLCVRRRVRRMAGDAAASL